MLIDLFNNNSYMSYNIKAAHIIGLNNIIYVSALLSIYEVEIQSNSDIEFNHKHIENLTTFSESEQNSIIANLCEIGILKKNLDKYKFDSELFLNIILGNNKELTSDVKKITKKKTTTTGKISLRQKQFIALKENLTASNDELLEAYKGWIDGVFANPKGFLSNKSITVFQKTVEEFAGSDLDLALKIIEIATVNGYRDATWAINVFHKDYEAEYKKKHTQTRVAARKVILNGQVF